MIRLMQRTRRPAIAAGLLATVALLTVAPDAHAGPGDAIISNPSYSDSSYRVCRSLSTSTKCSVSISSSPSLAIGHKTSEFGWADADAVWCGEGYHMRIGAGTFDCSGSGSSARLIKVSGCVATCTIIVEAIRD